MQQRIASEHLVYAWQLLASSLWSNRIITNMTFNEINVCSLLNKKKEQNVTATELCRHTGLLKSQMNRLLSDMEKKGYLRRVRSDEDHRLVFLRMLPQGQTLFWQEREQIMQLVDKVVAEMGVSDAIDAADKVQQIAAALRSVTEKKG